MKHTEQTKEILSQIRKKWIADNKEKHPWKRKDKFISKPCEFFKKKLKDKGIEFIEELNPLVDRGYSIDVAIIDKLIGFEVNGNQHYNSDKTLKDYYKKRKEEIESLGWKLYDIHYTKVFDENFIDEMVSFIENEKEIPNLDFKFRVKEKKICKDCGEEISKNSKERCLKCHNISRRTKNFERNLRYKTKKEAVEKIIKHCECGNKISQKSNYCKKCYDFSQRKQERPEINLLKEEVDKYGYSATGRKYGVSDNSIRKWLKNEIGQSP